jgi:hypothetical protein
MVEEAALWMDLTNVMEVCEAISKAPLRVDEANESVETEIR